ncbi:MULTISPECIES: helix-turn-helix domain-containing protein [unclassified Pseudofrankia]|uniref:helix-turn-helix domain-containing protein n=1 Tax=unclassified Pseudofrankia TaxID=2994372 RepID=UPI0008DA8E05|nr:MULTISPECIES: XRE family transcriptional regulator [unclassified Pseudofrankia]MDT3441421.1 XRE family transcriptional regulator [Pseudofrankia sp. BMG5.37]OHV49073.1 XRE family transcriptional regulator [Pseudofrankia sp. BMG5.36]
MPAFPDAWAPDDEEMDLDGMLAAVGPRLRALRQERDLTLPRLSKATGISVSTLSRLESGQRRLTLELLLPLARAYRVPLDELVGHPQTADPRVHPRPFVRNGMTVIPLSRRPGGLQAFKMIIPARWPPYEPEQKVHEGYDWLYVLSGRLRLQLGEHDLVLAAGEVAEFDTRVPHAFSNPTPHPAEILSLVGPQGERVHIRARSAARPTRDA